jgi:hypothetical protein
MSSGIQVYCVEIEIQVQGDINIAVPKLSLFECGHLQHTAIRRSTFSMYGDACVY